MKKLTLPYVGRCVVIVKIDKALFAAEEGLARTLSDNLFIEYELARGLSSAAKFD